MANVNTVAKRRQIALAVAICLGTVGLVSAGLWVSNYSFKKEPARKPEPKEPIPDLTGVVDADFSDKLQRSAVMQNQLNNAAVSKEIDGIRRELLQLSKGRREDLERIKALEDEKALLQNQLDTLLSGPVGVPEGEPRPGMQNLNTSGVYSANPYAGLSDPDAIQTQYVPTAPTVGMDSTPFVYQASTTPSLPYILSGSFANALVIEGADANAAVTGKQDTAPMQFRLTGMVHMPNDKTADLRSCFVTAEGYGDVSSEREEVRTRRLSCSLPGGDIDMAVKGHVSFMGKNGIKGRVVMRNGKILGLAGAAGFLDGIGTGIEKVSTPTVGLGATASTSASDVLSGGLGGGASKAAQTLSDYYIKRAEQYHEVIPIGAGNKVTVVFQDGFQLQTLAEIQAAKVAGKTTRADSSQTLSDSGRKALQDVRNMKLGELVNP